MSTLSIPPNTFSAPPNTITLHSANKEVLRITHDGRLVTGEGLSTEEATQQAAKLLISSFEEQIQKMVETRIAAACEVEHKLRAELTEAKVERETVAEGSLRSLEAYIDKLKQFAERAEKAEAALAEWSVLNLWGGTPEIIHEFIKGQQNRIHHCQDLEAECLEQARLLGMSGEREADLLGKLERLARDKARMDWLEEKMWFVRANVMLHDEVPPYTVKTCDGIVHGATVRAAIDAAMKP